MIFFGYPIHRKHTKIIIIVLIILIGLFLTSCKIQFDPTTTSFKYLIQKESKWKQ
jgi:dolichol kinase